MKKEFREKSYGLVFEGGGARGAYEIGVWKAIKELGINISAVVGTSIGALNGALFVQGDYDKALEIWENIKYSSIIDVEDDIITKIANQRWREVSIHESGQQFLDIIRNRGLDITPLKKMMEEVLDEEALRKSPIDFGLVTFNLSDFKPMELMIEDIEEGQVSGYLLASSYLPSFKSERIFGKRFIDGGFYNVAPTSMLAERGYTDIIEVRIQGLGLEQEVEDSDVNIVTIAAGEPLGRILELNSKRAKLSIQLGYYDALQVFNGYCGNRYYFDAPYREATYLKEFLKLNRGRVDYGTRALASKHDAEEYESKERLICEVFLPLLVKKLKLNASYTYKAIYITLLELLAEKLEIDRFQIFTIKGIKGEIRDRLGDLGEEGRKELVRSDIIVEIAYWLGV